MTVCVEWILNDLTCHVGLRSFVQKWKALDARMQGSRQIVLLGDVI